MLTPFSTLGCLRKGQNLKYVKMNVTIKFFVWSNTPMQILSVCKLFKGRWAFFDIFDLLSSLGVPFYGKIWKWIWSKARVILRIFRSNSTGLDKDARSARREADFPCLYHYIRVLSFNYFQMYWTIKKLYYNWLSRWNLSEDYSLLCLYMTTILTEGELMSRWPQ